MNELIRILFLTGGQEKLHELNIALQGQFPYEERVVETAESLSTVLRSFQADIVLCLETTSAGSALESLRTEGRDLPVVLITRAEQESVAVELLSAGAEDYLLFGRLQRLPRLIKQVVYSRRWEEGGAASLEKPFSDDPQPSDGQDNLLFQAVPLPVWIYDKKTYRILDVNKAAIQHYGYSRKEFLQMSLMDLRPEEQLPSLFSNLEKAKTETGLIRFRRSKHWKKDGTPIDVDVFGFNIEFQAQKCTMVICQDITEREAANKFLAMVKTAAELAKVGSFEVDLRSNALILSPTVKEIYEVEPDYEGDLSNLFDFVKEGEHSKTARKAFQLAREKKILINMEIQIITARGSERWIKVLAEPKFFKGQCIQIKGSVQDIDKMKRAELEALQALAEKEVILESIGDAFWAVDKNWKITYWNRHTVELTGLSKEEAVGQPFWELYSDAVDSAFYKNFEMAIRENRVVAFEEYYEKTQGWYELKAYPSDAGLSVYFRNITKRKQSELQLQELNRELQLFTEELREANKGLEQFSYIVSHNLRAPVANILGLADILKQGEISPEMRERLQTEMVNNVSSLDAVITDLNAILEMKGGISDKRENIQLKELVHLITSGVNRLMKKEQVELLTDFSDKAELFSVRSYLHSIFQNLIFNSIKYRHPDRAPRIEISSERKEGKTYLSFRDNGLGIDLARKGEQVFGMYRRFHRHVEGKGMGLFMVKTQVELLGGKISVQSEVDKGTEFVLEFPDEELRGGEDEKS